MLWATGCALVFLFRFMAAATGGSLPDYFAQLWQTEDGLPQNAVSAIVQTRDGYLWLGTYSGVARFDGVRFVVFDGSNTPQLQSSRVTSLFEDADGNLWIGHETGELTRFKNGRFEAVPIRADWKGGKIVAIVSDAAGDIWLASEEGLLVRARDGLVLSPPAGTAQGLLAVARNAQGTIWIARQGKVSALTGSELMPVEFATEPADSYVQGICASRDGGFWVASDGRVRKWRDNRWTQDLGEAPWGYSHVIPLVETQDGYLAGGTVDFGLFLIVPGKGTLHFGLTNGLPQNWVRSLCEDREGNLWIGAGSSGLVALRAGKVAPVNPPDRWQGRAVLSLTPRRDGSVWIATEGVGLYRHQESQWTRFGESNGLANPFVWSVSEDAQGRLWAGTWGGGVFMQRNDRFERVAGLEDVTAPAPALLHGANGVTWIGTGDGLLRYEAGKATKYGRQDGLELPDVRTVAQANDGTIWFGMSGGGLGRLKNGKLRQYRKSDGLGSDFVLCFRVERDGVLWVGTFGGGLTRFKDERFVTVGVSQGLPNNVICAIEEDERGYFWMSSHAGILRVSKEELNRCADGRSAAVSYIAYGKGEGLPTLECSGGFQPAACKTADGRLWFPTSKGLVAVDPNEVKHNQWPPPVVIEELHADGHRVNADASASLVRIPPGHQQFEFHYTGLSFTVPEKVRFKYRLEGLEPDWMDAGTKRSVSYSYLRPGVYTFRVTACNNDGVWNNSGAAMSFAVLPFFWQTWWFRGIAAAAGAGVVAAVVRYDTRRRLRRKMERLERQRAIERERARIAKDIHDDLGASLTRITLLSQTVRGELEHTSQAAADVDRIYGTARELTRAMDEIVWAVNPEHDTLDSLATYLGRFAQDFLSAAHVRCRLDLPLHLPAWPLTAEVRHNLFLAFKEALNNVVKHAGTSEARISLTIGRAGFALCVEDIGRGFVPGRVGTDATRVNERLVSGNGLANMRERLMEIGGCCEIQSVAGEGTKVIFSVPVKVSGSSNPD
jgi:ligand-binding sensor domain-containing protein/two-component sensor histidine kinase